MEAHRTRHRWTWSEFARLPSEGGARHEIVGGELVVTPAPGPDHQRVVTDLVTILNAFVRAHGLGQVFAGPIDVLLGERDYLEPDVAFVRTDRADLVTERGIEGPPDLVVEVLSPSTASRDRGVKRDRYRERGVALYWVVDRDARTVEVYDFAAKATAPRVFGADDTLRWQPVEGGPELVLRVSEVYGADG